MEKDALKSGLAFGQAGTRLFCRIRTQRETNPRANLSPGGNSLVAVIVQWVALSQSRQFQAMHWKGILWCLEKKEERESKAVTFLPSALKERGLVESLNLGKKKWNKGI